MGKFARSWALMKSSANILRQDKELMLFPLFAGLASLAVIATFAWPVFTLIAHHRAGFEGQRGHASPMFMLVSFLFYFVQYTVVIFFNTALASAAMIRLDGGNPTVRDGVRLAMGKLPNIIGYALISATVGMILRALQERFGLIGRIVVGLLGFGWTVATFLVVPVLAAQDVGPIDAIKRSASLLRDTWGENLIGNAGIGVAGSLLTFGLLLVSGMLFLGAVATHSVALMFVVGAAAVIGLVALSLFQTAMHGVYSAALYRFAEEGDPGQGFDRALLESAFRPKG
ncbi:hypothetical protein BJI69_09335 [Luteibacter rhizovicinus DSM 16549]|jgi:hypothetical protein|uniref:Uncharacterized protein n=1 Tax=Luteibacter rhizovicinus DSM 16549 TaxID=1440763 RepID=A0A0G9HBC3_9GAMM|nr:DUF6159 family protein [Luteibacter rhizovicinus]APG04076.1 hypothetical protein BJI69_09335 [Luteibacter rhizovicinus DSM 16549]KLD66539.1 hypothetical protein Y883_12895 [Luteibacter rhizovicinus DSM 16549]KLD77165.1 hypothetical protein Y886_17155 [Xanthomonas hyacinthi DSM 19077]